MVIDWQIKVDDPRFLVLTVDGEVWQEVYKSLFFRSLKNLKRCQSREDLEVTFCRLEEKIAFDHCVRVLSARSYTSFELKTKLLEKKLSIQATEGAISKCTHLGYLNDEGLAAHLIERLRQKGKGDRYIALSLKKRLGYLPHLPRDEKRERESIRQLISRFTKNRHLSDPKEKNRLIRKLERWGFSLEVIFQEILRVD